MYNPKEKLTYNRNHCLLQNVKRGEGKLENDIMGIPL